MKPGSQPVTSYSSTYFYLIKTKDGMSEEGEFVVSCCFSTGFDLWAKQQEQELDFREDFVMGQRREQRHPKMSHLKGIYIGFLLPWKRWDREGILLACKYHTSKQWNRPLWQQGQNHRICLQGSQDKKVSISLLYMLGLPNPALSGNSY